MSQEKLAEALGLTFQQVQKYERGLNRIGSSNLYKISRVLGVPVEFFFEDMPHDLDETSNPKAPAGSDFDLRQVVRRETVHLVRAFYAISDAQTREQILRLVCQLAGLRKGG